MLIKETEYVNYIEHYGTPRRSGRYPWGSGGDVERSRSFLDVIMSLFKKGMTETQVAESFDITVKELRAYKSIAKHEVRAADIAMAQRLKDKGYHQTAIGERMGVPESTVRSYLAPGAAEKADVIQTTARLIKKEVDERGYIDVGLGVENYLNVSRERLDTAIIALQAQGYEVFNKLKGPQLASGNQNNLKVIAPPGTEFKEIVNNLDKINQFQRHLDDTGKNDIGLVKPLSIKESRVAIKYAEDGGAKEDGLMYIRPGVEDLSLGGKSYAQVRIQVGEGHYLKGMAIYKDDLPDGVDILFNTNKTKEEAPKTLDVLKKLEKDPDNPFGAQLRRQITDVNSKGERYCTSAVNLVNEEGNWSGWKDSIASQVLSKQDPRLAKQQLDMVHERKLNEFNAIMDLTNPTIKKKLLKEFSESADSAAVTLQAAKLPRQAWRTILPIPTLKDNEVYAPGYDNGERIALIRYPHGGTFEIPELVVNNRHRPAKNLLGDARDAIGINHNVAERLSGADFDGDTVLAIPNNSGKIKSTPALEGLKNFDHRAMYAKHPGMQVMTEKQKQMKMGEVSNLITDMTIKGAPATDIARAVRHSMVVIDAVKHELNHKQSALDNGIKQLKEKYQTKEDGKSGASTIISRAKSPQHVPKVKPRPYKDGGPIDKETGELIFVPTGEVSYKTGKPALQKRKSLELTTDAHTLSSGQRIERIYADHSNRMKDIANRARLAEINTPRAKRNPSAAKVYANEVASLSAKLNLAERNKPLERQANIVAQAVVKQKRDANPDMTYETRRKLEYQALEEARSRIGAERIVIKIEPKEWEAIQAGAISDTKLENILTRADKEQVREYATPKDKVLMTSTNSARAKGLLAQGYTRAEVALQLGVSLSTLERDLYGEN